MPAKIKWYRDPRLWLEGFVLVNLAFLSLDIYLAHSVNQFHRAAEYIPLYFSLGGLAAGLALGLGITLLSELRDKTLRTEEDVEFFLQLPTLANIPSVEGARRHAAAGKGSNDGPRLVASA